MVTAILIPAILLYFYIVSKRERKQFEENWNALVEVKEEAAIHGKIISKTEEKQRFYYHKFVLVTEIIIKSGISTITAKRILPIKESINHSLTLNIGDEITCIGEWKEDYFQFIQYKIMSKK
ncbi:hypothetical protein ACLM5H_19720 [Fredinandcohnia humi]